QVGRRPAQLVQPTDPPAGHAGGAGRGLRLLALAPVLVLVAVREDPGRQAVHPDPVAAPLHRQRLGEVGHGGLGRGRMRGPASRTSTPTPNPLPPASSTAATPAPRCSGSRLAIATDAPKRANSTAIARPRPVPPPVISTTSLSYVPGGNIAVPAGGGSGSGIR